MPEKESGESLGAYLTRVRELKGESVEDLAHRVRLPLEVVKGIESDAWDKFETEAYIRGYVNSIGQHFGLNKAVLMGYFNEAYNSRYNITVNPLSDTSVQKVVPTSSNPALVVAAVIVLIIALVVVLKYFSSAPTDGDAQQAQQAVQQELSTEEPDKAPAAPDTAQAKPADTAQAAPAKPADSLSALTAPQTAPTAPVAAPAKATTKYPVAEDMVTLRCNAGAGADTLCRVEASYRTYLGKDTVVKRYFKSNSNTNLRGVSRVDTLTARISSPHRMHLFINGQRVRFGDDNVLWVVNGKFVGSEYASNPWSR
jgi:cytoskeletal protein RodZ